MPLSPPLRLSCPSALPRTPHYACVAAEGATGGMPHAASCLACLVRLGSLFETAKLRYSGRHSRHSARHRAPSGLLPRHARVRPCLVRLAVAGFVAVRGAQRRAMRHYRRVVRVPSVQERNSELVPVAVRTSGRLMHAESRASRARQSAETSVRHGLVGLPSLQSQQLIPASKGRNARARLQGTAAAHEYCPVDHHTVCCRSCRLPAPARRGPLRALRGCFFARAGRGAEVSCPDELQARAYSRPAPPAACRLQAAGRPHAARLPVRDARTADSLCKLLQTLGAMNGRGSRGSRGSQGPRGNRVEWRGELG